MLDVSKSAITDVLITMLDVLQISGDCFAFQRPQQRLNHSHKIERET